MCKGREVQVAMGIYRRGILEELRWAGFPVERALRIRRNGTMGYI